MDEDQLRQQARARLRSLGPVTAGELVRDLGLEDQWTALELRQLLLDETVADGDAAFLLLDGRLCDLDHLIDGLTLTHVVTHQERQAGVVAFAPDLAAAHLVSFDGRTFPLAGGEDRHLVLESEGLLDPEELTGPEGWLPAEEVLVLRLVDGRVEVSGLRQLPEVHAPTAERLSGTLEALRDQHSHAIDEIELLLGARARYPRLLATPQAPLEVLLAAVDLVSTDGGVLTLEEAEAEEADEDDPTAGVVAHLREDHGLTTEQIVAVLGVQGHVMRRQREALEANIAAMREAVSEGRDFDDARLTDLERHEAEAPIDAVDLDAAAEQLAVALGDVEAAMALVEDVVDDDPLAAACTVQRRRCACSSVPGRDRHSSVSRPSTSGTSIGLHRRL